MQKGVDLETELKENCFSHCDNEDTVPIICLFCNEGTPSWNKVMSHLEHKFSYVKITSISFYDELLLLYYISFFQLLFVLFIPEVLIR